MDANHTVLTSPTGPSRLSACGCLVLSHIQQCRPGFSPLCQVRMPTHIVSTICDDRGEEPTYNGVPMSELMEMDANMGDVIG